MLGLWLARGVVRSASRNRAPAPPQPPQGGDKGNWGGLVIFALLLPLMIAGIADGYHGHASFADTTAFVLAFWALLVVLMAAGSALRAVGGREVLSRYADDPGEVPEADRWRELAALLRERDRLIAKRDGTSDVTITAPLAVPPAVPDDVQREVMVTSLFLVRCPEPACEAPVTIGCAPRLGVIHVIVRKFPIAYCHLPRVRAALDAGTVDEQELAAQFGGKIPEGAV